MTKEELFDDCISYFYNTTIKEIISKMEWNYNLNEAPIDTPIQLLSRDDSPILPQQEFVGTITYGHKNELTRGKCLVGDPDYFYRSAMVAWKDIQNDGGKR